MHFATVALVLVLLAGPFIAEAQPPGTVPRVGVLANVRSPATEAFQKGLRELGYIEGQNIIVEWRLAEGRFERLPELAAELVRLNVDVIVAPAPPYVYPARKATTTIPIIFALVPDPVESGFVKSLARPGGNITGLASNAFELHGKRLELLKEAVPGIGHIGILTNPRTDEGLRDVERAAASLGIQRHVAPVAQPEDIDQAFSLMKAKRVGAVVEVGNSPIA
jgi:putative ABC transport system substrate-binding protein